MSPRRLKPITVYFEPEQLEMLTALSLETHIPKAVYVRQGLELILGRIGAARLAETLCRPRRVKASKP